MTLSPKFTNAFKVLFTILVILLIVFIMSMFQSCGTTSNYWAHNKRTASGKHQKLVPAWPWQNHCSGTYTGQYIKPGQYRKLYFHRNAARK